MSSPPENMKLEGLIADNWDESVVTPGIVDLLEPYREDMESIAERFEENSASWRDYRQAVWAPVPHDVEELVARVVEDIRRSTNAGKWVRRAGEPDVDSPDGVDLLVGDDWDLADFICMGVVVTKQDHTDRGIVARVRFPPRCSRHRFIPGTGEGIAVMLPKGEVSLEGGSDPWTVRLRKHRDNIDISGVALADLAREIMKRGAFVVFEDPTDIDVNRFVERVATPFLSKLLGDVCGRSIARDQPPPATTEGKAIWDLVIDDLNRTWGPSPLLSEAINEDRERLRTALVADMRERDRIGRERYGTPLQAFNGRDALVDAYQEALDGTVYVRQRIEEDPEDHAASILYGDFLEMTYRLRGILLRRNK